MFNFAVKEFDDEPRMRDLDIARALGFEDVHKIRLLIGRHMATLEAHGDVVRCSYKPDAVDGNDGEVSATVAETPRPNAGGRPGVEYWLNEWQALFICTRSDAPNAIEVTSQMIEVFIAWRQGRLAPHPEVADGASRLCGFDLAGPEVAAFLSMSRELRLTAGRAAARAMWEKSAFAELLRGQGVDKAQVFGGAASDALADVMRFITDGYDVTGHATDKIAASELALDYAKWRQRNDLPDMLPHAMFLQLKAASAQYRHPVSGKGFHAQKSSNATYRGLRARRDAAVGE